MNRKTTTAFVGVLLLMVLIVALMKNRTPVAVGAPAELPNEIYTEVPQEPVVAPTRETTGSDDSATTAADSGGTKLEQASQIKGASLQEKIKNTKLINLTEYREEVKKNPHGTPTKFIESSLKLGTLFDTVKTEEDATEVLQYYKGCLSSEAPAPLKVTCYTYSKRIAEAYPSLKKDFDPFYSGLDPEVRKVVDLTAPQQ